ncbi:MAG: methylenetetrahydrofolate reductase [Alphaproteobacteria bacterium]|nr:methylenetetrahydrofolate reductase [Alphaproteobacteria bacterium]
MHGQSQPNGVSINGIYPLNDGGEVQVKPGRKAKLSFEVFPAKTQEAVADLLAELRCLSVYNPEFISVTYGAGGSAREGTIQTSKAIQEELSTDVMAHLTFSNQGRGDVLAVADRLKDIGIKQILALRGDDVGKADTPISVPFGGSIEFIKGLADRGWQNIRVAAYPDMHKDAKSADADFDWLLAKFDAGASEAITQFFFDAESFFRLRDRLDKFGLADRLIPGILAFDDISKMLGFAGHCGVCIPPALTTELEKSARTDLSAAHSLSVLLDLWLRLSAQGVDRYHIYTLNKAQPTQTLLELLGIPKHPDALPSCHKQTIMS